MAFFRNIALAVLTAVLCRPMVAPRLWAATPVAPAPVTSPPPVRPALSSNDIRAHALAKVFQLATKVTAGTEKESYGTAFVVDPRGYLITGFHVVSSAVLKPSRYVLELKSGESGIPARVVALDVPNDLAVIQVGRTFTDSYRFAAAIPAPGEKLYSLGVPEDTVMTIIEGLYSDIRLADPVSRLIFSAPLNHGMSGGPLINEREEIVGVNDAILGSAQNISMAVPGESAYRLLYSLYQPGRAIATALDQNSLAPQIAPVLQAWIERWRVAQNAGAGPRFGGYQLSAPPPGSKCWQNETKKEKGALAHVGTYMCRTPDSFPIGNSQHGGYVALSYVWKNADGKSRITDSFSESELTPLLKARALADFVKRSADPNEKTGYVCHHRYVTNSHGEELLVDYCVAEAVRGTGLYDAVLTASPFRAGTRFHGEIQLGGFTEEALKSISETFLNSIQGSGGGL